jgi:hypothetical protein
MKQQQSWIWYGLGVAVVIGGLVGGLVLAQRQPAAGKVMEKALIKLAEAERWQVKADLKLHLPQTWRGRERPFREVVLSSEGQLVRQNEGGRAFQGEIAGEAKGRGNIFFTDGEIVMTPEATAFRLENMPVLLNPSGSLLKKWTEVPVALLQTNNTAEIVQELREVVQGLQAAGAEEVEGEKLFKYQGALTEEQRQRLIEVLKKEVSGSEVWHVLARLLNANQVESLTVWTTAKSSSLKKVEVKFVRPLKNGGVYNLAELELVWGEAVGQSEEIALPEKQQVVQPGVFAKLFGQGEISPLKANE